MTQVAPLTCATCGSEEPEGSRFCGSCGTPFVAADPQPAAAAVEPGRTRRRRWVAAGAVALLVAGAAAAAVLSLTGDGDPTEASAADSVATEQQPPSTTGSEALPSSSSADARRQRDSAVRGARRLPGCAQRPGQGTGRGRRVVRCAAAGGRCVGRERCRNGGFPRGLRSGDQSGGGHARGPAPGPRRPRRLHGCALQLPCSAPVSHPRGRAGGVRPSAGGAGCVRGAGVRRADAVGDLAEQRRPPSLARARTRSGGNAPGRDDGADSVRRSGRERPHGVGGREARARERDRRRVQLLDLHQRSSEPGRAGRRKSPAAARPARQPPDPDPGGRRGRKPPADGVTALDRGRRPLPRRLLRRPFERCPLPPNESFTLAGRSDVLASAAKQRFVAVYNPLARSIGRKTWSASEI